MNPRKAEFEKCQKLGSGSFGVVWQVHRRSDGEDFALKEIDLRKPGLQQVMKEVETMTQLPPHPNIVRLHAHWISDNRKDMWLLLEYAPVLPALYICNIVQRYCSEGNLAQFLLSTVRLPDAALWDLAGQLLRALCVFEQHRIVHNDIKPENIFITAGSVPKIGDLGMARFTSAGSVLTNTPGGTPMFQAPEVLSKERGADGRPICFPEYAACEISYESDVYSLGAVMWSLIMRRNPDRPGGAFPLTPALVADSRLRELVNDMLQPDPAKRHRASHLILRFPPAPAPAPASVSAPALATVCIRRDDGSDRTLLRVRPTNSRAEDAFVAPKVVIYDHDRLRLLQTVSAEGSSFSLVKTSSGVEGYVQSKYIAPAPAPFTPKVFAVFCTFSSPFFPTLLPHCADVLL
jgi:serine/threonine protein kinase